MARASKRRSQLDQLQHENEELREASRQLFAGLVQYARDENWRKIPQDEPGSKPDVVWIGEGSGPELARKFLGLENNTELN